MAPKSKISQDVEVDIIPVEENDGIIINDNPFAARTLPLIITLPKDASPAQVERAKILNSYAYSNPKGWESRKWHLIEELKALKNAPIPKEDPNAPKLSVGSKILGVLPE